MSQPPLSQAIRHLEDELGVRLLERTSRSVVPTDAGRAFAEEARRVLANVEVAVGEARRAAGARSVLRIGCAPFLPIDLLQQFLVALRTREPTVRTDVTNLVSLDQVQRLRAGELDLGLFYLIVPYDRIETEPMFPGEPLEALLPLDHPLAAKAVLTPDDLLDEVLVWWSRAVNPVAYESWLAMFERGGYRFRTVHEGGGPNPRDLILAVASGWGVTLGPLSYLEGTQSTRVVLHRPLDQPLATPDTGVAWRSNPPRQLDRVLNSVREIARELRAQNAGQSRAGSRRGR